MPQEVVVIVGMGKYIPEADMIASQTRFSCFLCHGDAWMSPSSVELIRNNPESVRTICFACALSHADSREALRTADNTVESLAADTGLSLADAATVLKEGRRKMNSVVDDYVKRRSHETS